MLSDVVLLILGLALLVRGGSWFVGAAVRLAEFLHMPRVVIGSTIVSLATTTPEFVVSVIAAARGTPSLAVGNAIGSCVCNVGLVLGITAVMRRVHVEPGSVRLALATMLGLGVALFFMVADLRVERWQGMLLLLAGALYFMYDFVRALRNRAQPGLTGVLKAARAESWRATRFGTFVQFGVAAGVVVLASRVLVDAAVRLASGLGIPPLVIGLTVVAVGTSLPELVTAVGSARRQVSDLAVGNILGANISNLCLVIGIAAALQPIDVSRATHLFDFPAMLVLMVILVWTLWTQSRLTRREGLILLGGYIAYITGVVVLTVLGYRAA